jgi:uncharacterized membrane protein YcfT
MVKQRIQWMDAARGLCILLVILMHATVLPGARPPWLLSAFNQAFEPFRMPVLMFLSGFLLERSLAKPLKPYLVGKLNQIYWPCIFWTIVILSLTVEPTIWQLLEAVWKVPTYLWYLQFLFIFYIVALPISYFRIPVLFVIIISLILAPLVPGFLRLPRMCFLFAFFMLGHYVWTNRNVFIEQRIPTYVLLVSALLVTGGALLSASSYPVQYRTLFAWIPLAMLPLLLSYGPKLLSGAIAAPFAWVGRNGIVFYASHVTIQILLLQTLPFTEFGVRFAVALGGALGVGVLLQIARSKVPVLGFPFDLSQLFAPVYSLHPAADTVGDRKK